MMTTADAYLAKAVPSQYRYWCFTSFEAEEPVFTGLPGHFLTYQREECPKTGQGHWQGMIGFPKKVRLTAAKAFLGHPSAHLEVCRNIKASMDYCRKAETAVAGSWRMHGDSPLAWSKNETTVIDDLKKCSVMDLVSARPTLWRNVRILKDLKASLLPSRSKPTKCYALVGPTGCGKTRTALEIAKFVGTYVFLAPELRWHDPYCGEDVCIVDEFRGDCSVSHLLRLCDRYPMKVEVKGGWVEFAPSVLIITSNLHPEAWYAADAMTMSAIRRRLTVIEFK